MAMPQFHSIPARPQPQRCETIAALPHPRLRPYVLGYAGFRSGDGACVAHRILPLNLTTLVIDCTGPYGLVTGPRSTPMVSGQARWRQGVSVGLTPAGVSGLLGVPMAELAEQTVQLPDLLGHRAAELTDRLGRAPDWPSRFALLDEHLSIRSELDSRPDGAVAGAWYRLQHAANRPRIGRLAEQLGVSRRHLEHGFRRQIGLSPATVSRIARFQHAIALLSQGSNLARTAADSGYADQSHFNREVRAMAGLTPTELCAFLQYRQLDPG